MRVTTEWLNEYVELGDWGRGEAGARALAAALTGAGLAVEALAEVAGEPGNFALELETPANRTDLLSLLGVARELAALSGRPLRPPAIPVPAGESGSPVPVEVRAPDLCPRYTARLIEKLSAGPSPAWLVRRLAALGCSAINNLVDVTNYVMFETGQPLHAFDLELLSGSRIVVRRAAAGEKLTLLDGAQLALVPEALVIADARAPVALAGVMGGLNSGVRPETRTILLESAEFVSRNIRRTRRALGAPETESSRRFEHGVEAESVELASRRAAALLAELGGGKVRPGMTDVRPARAAPRELSLRLARAAQLLGAPVAADEAARILELLGFAVLKRDAAALVVRVPAHRRDVGREVDLIEELARVRGYDRIPERIALPARVPAASPAEALREELRRGCLALGYDEATSESLLDLERARAAGAWDDAAAVRLANPPRAQEPALRQSLLPSLLAVRKTNQDAAQSGCAFFELGHVYRRPVPPAADDDGRPAEPLRLALLDDAGLDALKGALETLLGRLEAARTATATTGGLAPPAVSFRPAAREYLAPEKAAEIFLNLGGAPTAVGLLGEPSAAALQAYGLKAAPAVAELDLAPLLAARGAALRVRPLPRFPAVDRDVALVVAEATSWDAIRQAVAAAAAPEVEALEFLSLFRGAPIPSGKKSVAFALRYRSAERTLTDAEVAPLHAALLAALRARLAAQVRGEDA